ncbi:MAG: LemA family protein [Bacillota bacterium]
MAGIIFLVLLIIVAGYAVYNYNTIIRLKNRIENAWAQIDVQLERRHDLIPNLVETVKGYMEHEKETLEKVIEARSKAMQASGVEEKAEAESLLEDAVNKLFLVVEDYPELKANENFLNLQEEITSTENRIAYARQSYNDQVMFYNNKIATFPGNMIAGSFGFEDREYFEIEDEEKREVPDVEF